MCTWLFIQKRWWIVYLYVSLTRDVVAAKRLHGLKERLEKPMNKKFTEKLKNWLRSHLRKSSKWKYLEPNHLKGSNIHFSYSYIPLWASFYDPPGGKILCYMSLWKYPDGHSYVSLLMLLCVMFWDNKETVLLWLHSFHRNWQNM